MSPNGVVPSAPQWNEATSVVAARDGNDFQVLDNRRLGPAETPGNSALYLQYSSFRRLGGVPGQYWGFIRGDEIRITSRGCVATRAGVPMSHRVT